ncbi:nitric oxide reductase activation protein NorD [Massilia scottii]|uniref:nitric oxide reductase activation protein NorD n=1 Tax=Massilia scottii TaxID=3057166 RepID=UPI00279673FE|nr:hypothetical protein [Massilia sp. CCM 9029]MDQ1833861.1 hypothetical protein [Massilia sp. CCM 9029]
MAEAEDVITDAARHATVFVQAYWRRHRPRPGAPQLELADVAARLDLLAQAVFGRTFRLRPSQPPSPRTFLDKILRRHEAPPAGTALPGTDGDSIWLPRAIGLGSVEQRALARYRLLLLQQAMRATRGSALHYPQRESAWVQACYHLLEARAADDALARLLPGMAGALQDFRLAALAARPPLRTLAPSLRPLEQALHAVLSDAPADAGTPLQVLEQARRMAAGLAPLAGPALRRVLVRDDWLGELMPVPAAAGPHFRNGANEDDSGPRRSARLARRPRARQPQEEDDEQAAGPMMVQTAQPHEQAEDAMGVQRPTDRDTGSAAEDFADALSELPEARMVSTPGAAREVLLSDDPPDARARQPGVAPQAADGEACPYPEWDWKTGCYRDPGAIVTVRTALPGAQATVDAIFRRQAPMLREVRRQFELLRARRTRLRQQLDGDAIDLQGWIDNQAQKLAGGNLDQRLYEAERRARRDLAVMLLVDISGSTDSWVSGQCRVIDVEREALLMVCAALQGLGEPFSVLGFSGEGPGGVVVRAIKRFQEPYGNDVALRIAGLEPENYTRAGAAVRHASAALMMQAARHKLLIVISDGKPNDVDQYDGRYGVEDVRQAVTEARLQGISPFCLTIDRQAATYLPAVFGEHAYALLQRAELLPTVLPGWLRKLVAA